MAATHGVRVYECRSHSRHAGDVRDVVKVTLWIGSVVVNGRGNDRMPNRQACRCHLKSSRGTHCVAYHGFDGTHGDVVGGWTKRAAKRARLYEVEVGQGVPVCVDVVKRLRGAIGLT